MKMNYPCKEIENKVFKYKKELKEGLIKHPKKVVENFVRFKAGDNLQTLTKADLEAMKLTAWSDFNVFVGCMRKEVCIRKIAQNVEWNGQSPDTWSAAGSLSRRKEGCRPPPSGSP